MFGAGERESGVRWGCSGDFLPYADNAKSFWVGYYVTRPALKVFRGFFVN